MIMLLYNKSRASKRAVFFALGYGGIMVLIPVRYSSIALYRDDF